MEGYIKNSLRLVAHQQGRDMTPGGGGEKREGGGLIMMKNIKHNAAQVAAPSNLSLSRGDRFLRVCAWETSSARTMKHLLAPLRGSDAKNTND